MTSETETSAQRYGLIPEQPKPVLDGGHAEFLRVAQEVTDWVCDLEDDSDRLRIAGIWGDRGTGKTSMLLTILQKLREREDPRLILPEANDVDTDVLFEPTRLRQHDGILLCLLTFLKRRYWKGFNSDDFEKIFELEAKREHPERFLDYMKDIASTEEALAKLHVDFFQESTERTLRIKERMRKAFAKRRENNPNRSLVLMIDDLDLSPHFANELLETLHIFCGSLSMTVLLVADRVQLAKSICDARNDTTSLAADIIAKHTEIEWLMPVPTEDERKELIWRRTPSIADWWRNLEIPLHVDLSPQDPEAKTKAQNDPKEQDRPNDMSPSERRDSIRTTLEDLFARALPGTWRGLNRYTNRMRLLSQRFPQTTSAAMANKYSRPIGCAAANAGAFISLIMAIDETFSELGIFAAFEAEPERLRQGLSLNWIDPQARPETVLGYPVLDRLLDEKFIAGRRRGRAQDMLSEFGHFWVAFWIASAALDAGGEPPWSLLTISVQRDAEAHTAPWWENTRRTSIDTATHFHYESDVAGERPSAAKIREIKDKIEQDLKTANLLNQTNQLRIFAFAPLSVLAWLGWRTRYCANLHALTQVPGEASLTAVEWIESELGQELRILRRIEYDPNGASRDADAAIVIDVRQQPDEGQPPPFVDEQDQPRPFGRVMKLVSEYDFRLTDDGDVASIIHDIRLVLRVLKRDHGVQRVHMAFACPSALAILIGRALHPWAPVLLYEYMPTEPGPRYEFIATIG